MFEGLRLVLVGPLLDATLSGFRRRPFEVELHKATVHIGAVCYCARTSSRLVQRHANRCYCQRI